MGSSPTEESGRKLKGAVSKKPLPEIVLCGYERGGTTLLSQIFRENGFISGFEVGVLMCSSPAEFPDFKPYSEMLHAGWGLGKRISMEELCDGDFEHFYRRLAGTAYPRKLSQRIFDKTPIYMSRLGYVLQQTAFINKAVVITRDPRAVFTSWAKRQLGETPTPKAVDREVQRRLSNYAARYLKYFAGSIAHRNADNVMFVAYEDLCTEPTPWIERLGEFAVGQPFALEKLTHKFNNVYGDAISTDNVLEFERYLTVETRQSVLEATQSAFPFFYQHADANPYEDSWRQLQDKVRAVLRKYSLNELAYVVDGEYFEPETYLLRYPDVLSSAMDPRVHYRKHGKAEGRLPS